jgi:hypothetical protein
MRRAGVSTLEQVPGYLDEAFLPMGEQRFAVAPHHNRYAHHPGGRPHRLEQILSVREACSVALSVTKDYAVAREGRRRGVARVAVQPGLRGASVELGRRFDASLWLRFRNRHLALHPCLEPPRLCTTPSGPRPPGLVLKPKPELKTIPPSVHPWRTFLFGGKPDISTLR